MKIIDYKVVTATNNPSISEVVAEFLRDGWKPLGHCVIGQATEHFGPYAQQTLVKYEQEQPNGRLRTGATKVKTARELLDAWIEQHDLNCAEHCPEEVLRLESQTIEFLAAIVREQEQPK